MSEKHFTAQISLSEMEIEIKREIAVRQKVYPQWIIDNRLKPTTAAFRVLVLEAVLIKLQREIKETAPQKELFG